MTALYRLFDIKTAFLPSKFKIVAQLTGIRNVLTTKDTLDTVDDIQDLVNFYPSVSVICNDAIYRVFVMKAFVIVGAVRDIDLAHNTYSTSRQIKIYSLRLRFFE